MKIFNIAIIVLILVLMGPVYLIAQNTENADEDYLKIFTSVGTSIYPFYESGEPLKLGFGMKEIGLRKYFKNQSYIGLSVRNDLYPVYSSSSNEYSYSDFTTINFDAGLVLIKNFSTGIKIGYPLRKSGLKSAYMVSLNSNFGIYHNSNFEVMLEPEIKAKIKKEWGDKTTLHLGLNFIFMFALN